MTTEEEEKPDLLKSLAAILIAIVVVIGGIVAWRVSVAQDGAGDADYAGLRAVTNTEETRALNYVNAYESYGSYATYWRYNRLGTLLSADAETADEEQLLALEEQTSQANDLADANRYMFDTRFMNRDGSYSVERQLGEMWADAAKEKDLESASKFAEADQLNVKVNRLMIAFLILSLAPIFYALVESFEGRTSRLVMVILGSIFTLGGTILAIVTEFAKL